MSERVPVLRISLANATVLSALYLVLASAVELIRRAWNPRWAEPLSLSLEAFPARMLSFLGLFEPLQRAWLEDHLSPLAVRLVYGVTVVGLIFFLGAVVGLLMASVARLAQRRAGGDKPPL